MRQEELEQYIQDYGKDLFSFCCSVTRSRDEAEELYQDTFLKLYEIGEKLVIEANPKSYLMGISVNIYRNYKRKLSVRQRIVGVTKSVEEMDVEPVSEARLPEEEVIEQEECRFIRSVVGQLPDKYRLPILLFYMEELPLAEIAAVLKLPEGTVKSRLYRAKKILKQKLEEREGYGHERQYG
ncbi:MAG: RNA polymerase sigma factor [Lachnospiraceae bacterium]|nr:RNA polymerase sigma factor [Lachnospiraceae bacterium]